MLGRVVATGVGSNLLLITNGLRRQSPFSWRRRFVFGIPEPSIT
jgi:hypothetical protein